MFDIVIDDATERHLLIHIIKTQEKAMTDFSKLTADIADLAAKVDALIAKQTIPPAPPVDEQPAVDAADASVQAIIAKIPA